MKILRKEEQLLDSWLGWVGISSGGSSKNMYPCRDIVPYAPTNQGES